MAINSVRTALQLLSGAGEVTRAKALEAAGTLLELPGVGETSARAGQLAEELIEAATANQAMVSDLVRTEVDGRLAFLGLARGSDLEAAQRKIEALEREVAELRETVGKRGTSAGAAAASGGAGVTRTAIKTPATPAAGSGTAAKAPASPKAPAKKTAKKAATPAKRATATNKSTTAKKSAATKKSAAKKTAKKTTTKAATPAAAKKASSRRS
ncbi:hypothetical protein GCM10011492_24080 [Flexivirga endophytica]|uniref:Polyhydroxyalkanoate synthesis protein PhaF n=1 Tax=Flexivirga endophytica TaxID=1849103 RepID=A0A916WV75_9MICO|nr:hypothetical protein [Flexivirga endophytica]GGB32706.1 hypothetical protein GCM10011492_24080 [Flexivirga endophytica]GHB40685.1 hypothetical protein GCM10008112_06470 [Flexivirga endophytica]